MSYRSRRKLLHQTLGKRDGVIFWPGSKASFRNYPANPYLPFRQDSHFLYYVGLNSPDMAALSFPDGREILFGHPVDMDTIVWEGPQSSLEEQAKLAEVSSVRDIRELPSVLQTLGEFLYLPIYQPATLLQLSSWLGISPETCRRGASSVLASAVVEQRLIKSPEEIAEIESALSLTATIFDEAMARTRPGMAFSSLLGILYQRVRERLWDFSFNPILTQHGEILHTHEYQGTMEEGRLLLLDMGVETNKGYASDITRVWPISGKFSSKQREIYDVVLHAQQQAINTIRPGVPYREVHHVAALTIAEDLTRLGLMKGDPQEAVAVGAHALFFPHGVGHMMGLDVHDMEDLGDRVGYETGATRNPQFGLNFLRLARPLQAGFVVTVEPGIYFIPALFHLWKQENRHASFLDYAKIETYLDFGGIRIEDDVHVTEHGRKVLGEPISKTVREIETIMQASKALSR